MLTEAVLIVKTTEDASGLAWSIWIVPSKSVKSPRTLETKWRTWKLTSEWTLSTVNVSAAKSGAAARTAEQCKGDAELANHVEISFRDG